MLSVSTKTLEKWLSVFRDNGYKPSVKLIEDNKTWEIAADDFCDFITFITKGLGQTYFVGSSQQANTPATELVTSLLEQKFISLERFSNSLGVNFQSLFENLWQLQFLRGLTLTLMEMKLLACQSTNCSSGSL